jgi:hypothetical protein
MSDFILNGPVVDDSDGWDLSDVASDVEQDDEPTPAHEETFVLF